MHRSHRLARRLVAVAATFIAVGAHAQNGVDPLAALESAAALQAESEAVAAEHAEERVVTAIAASLGKANRLNRDERLAAIADKVPGFAGYTVGRKGRIQLRMTAAGGLGGKPGLEALRMAAGPGSDFVRSLGTDVELTAAQFDARQLLTQKVAVRNLISKRGAHAAWIDLEMNRVYVGHDPDLTAEELQALVNQAQARGMDLLAVVWVPLERARLSLTLNKSIQAQVQPLAGGSQFQYYSSNGAGYNCTVGVVAKRGGVLGFVTASHCTGTVANYNVPTTADAPLLGTYLGTELADPSGTACFSSLGDTVTRCRASDAAFYSAASVELGKIAITDSALKVTGSIDVSGTGSAALGKTVWKTGRTTGTTSGPVKTICIDSGANAPNGDQYYLLCQDEVKKSGFAAGGDSGAAVWTKANGKAKIVGIYAYTRGSSFFGYSPWSAVTSELGSLTVK